jgi:hypothetical protein
MALGTELQQVQERPFPRGRRQVCEPADAQRSRRTDPIGGCIE